MKHILSAIVSGLLAFQSRSLPAQSHTVAYVKNGSPEQVMDLYWPTETPTATLLFIHGGSLQESGERRTSQEYSNVCTQFVAHGIACASMDYRLAPTSQWPAMPNDVASALSFLKKEVAARGADSRKIFLFGHSSGCHLASIVGTNPVYLRSAGLDPGSVAGVIAMGCILDRDDATIRQLTPDKIRSAFNRDAQDVRTYGTPENYLAANPASFVSDSSARTLVIVADAERFMPAVMEQGARFVRLLLEHNVAANLVVVPGTHSSSIASLNKPDDPSLQAILRFMADPAKSAAAH